MANNALNFENKVVFLSGLPLTLPIAASDPGSAHAGDLYYNSVSNGIRFYNGTAWTPISTGGSAASTSLNNLASVAINTSLLPGVDNSINLGSGLFSWATANIHVLNDSGAIMSVDTYNRLLVDSTAATAVDYQNRYLQDASGNIQLSWSTAGVNLGVDASFPGTLNIASGMSAHTAISAQNTTSSYNFNLPSDPGGFGQVLTSGGGGVNPMTWTTLSPMGVTDVSVTTANGFAGTVATSMTTPAITIETTVTGVLYGDGTAVSAATAAQIPDLSAFYLPLTGGTMSGALNMGSNQINNLGMAGSPAGTDATTVSYVNSQISAAISGLTWQGPAQAYSNVNVPLTGGATLTIDGYSVQNNDRVLLANQTIASQNGEYIASGIGTAYVLTANGLPSMVGDAWLVTNGTMFGNSAFTATAAVPAATFTEFAGPTSLNFVAPLMLSGNTVTITQATTSTNGYLTSTDWNTFNLKQPAGNYITALTGDVTASGPGSAAATLATVNGSPGTFAIATVTVNGKGLVTSASAAPTTGTGSVVLAASPTLTGTVSAAAITMSGTLTTSQIASIGALLLDANSGSSSVQIESSNFQRSTNGTNFITETYTHSTTLVDNTTAAIVAFQFAYASFAGEEITYVIESGDATLDCRIGTLRVTANNAGTIVTSISDQFAETADCGVTWSASISGANVVVSYTTTTQGASRTMRSDTKLFTR